MQVGKGTVVTLKYQVSDTDGKMVDEGIQPIIYVHGGKDVNAGLFPGLQKALDGKKVGDSIKVTLDPMQAFGEYDADMVLVEPRDAFPKEIEVGTVLQLETDDGQTQLFQVVEINGDTVTVDGNHPLAGVSLVFSATVENVRAASPEEMSTSVPDTSEYRN